LYYPYRNAPFFEHIQEHHLTAESLVLLIINKVETVYDEKKDEDVKLESPIIRLKKLVGNKDPNEAKLSDPNSIRAKFGVDLIKNAMYCSDDPKTANKERDVFLFPIPERPPEFKYIKTKISL
jgi:nucleoside diphosphate kinase